MIYYTNAQLEIPHMAFIGRWSPFHKGHAAVIYKKLKELPNAPVLIMVRNTTSDSHPPDIRAEYIKQWMIQNRIKGTIMIIPNVEGVYWGRAVGYHTGEIDINEELKNISGTKIRNKQNTNDQSWITQTAAPKSASMLSPKIATILQQGLVLWLTGCPSSGKTTIANALSTHLRDHYPYLKIQILDGDIMRASPLANTVGFSQADRAAHIIRMAHLAKMFADHGILVICAFVSPDRKIREQARNIIGRDRFIEVYVRASKASRIKRDTKGMYKQAIEGNIKGFTGYNALYEAPYSPHIICNTNKKSIDECIKYIQIKLFSTTRRDVKAPIKRHPQYST